MECGKKELNYLNNFFERELNVRKKYAQFSTTNTLYEC